MDLKSILGYADSSPFRSNPYLDINSPEGIITMENTGIDLVGVDNLGNKQRMKAYRKTPYKFRGNVIRETPIAKKGGNDFKKNYPNGHLSPAKAHEMLHDGTAHGHKLTPEQKKYFGWVYKNNPYKLQHGGKPPQQLLKAIYDNLYSEDKPDTESENLPEENTAPSTEELQATDENQGQVADPNYDMAMQAAMGDEYDPAAGNPYAVGMPANPTGKGVQEGVNPYVSQSRDDILKNYNVTDLGIWGDKAHQGRVSDHNTGDAEDFGIKDPETGNRLVGQLQTEARQRNIKYIIYNGRIWNPSISQEWRKYPGPDPHDTHVHVSYNRKQGGYRKGGMYNLSHDDLAELKNQGYKFTIL